ncbi:SDR family oxidoreductase [Anaerolentibacter hominis]|uniref:SDR family NAD(P)-dependent oxidoreductase n=1 Tax=Anaerolentibacter hominis TaxID=3079009 RepID=UPI0031B8A2EA
MYALVTGASSGIGAEIARELAERGMDLILAARRKDKLIALKQKFQKNYHVNVEVMEYDLSRESSCLALYKACRSYPVRVVVNNAGFGKLGVLDSIPLREELDMIRTNVMAPQILTHLFMRRMKRGYILNVASVAGLQPCPMMAVYGATKAYLYQMSVSANYELKRQGRGVRVSVLCPGPVHTEFNHVAGSDFSLPSMSAGRCANAAVKGMFRGEEVIIPGLSTKLLAVGSRFTPRKLILPVEFWIQTRKTRR